MPAEYFCDEHCPITSNGVWLYIDGGRFSVAGSEYMGERAKTAFLKLLSK
jgi:hypothetical protein